MALERVDVAGNSEKSSTVNRASIPAKPVAEAPSRSTEQAPARAPQADAVELGNYGRIAQTMRENTEKLTKALDSRKKLVDALREVMANGQLETLDAARAAADGILRTAERR